MGLRVALCVQTCTCTSVIVVLALLYVTSHAHSSISRAMWPRNIDSLGAKELVMGMVNHGNSDVRMQALLAIQKMMVQNW